MLLVYQPSLVQVEHNQIHLFVHYKAGKAMKEIHAILFGIFLLVFVYLVVMNASGASGILSSTGTQSSTLIRTLQGR